MDTPPPSDDNGIGTRLRLFRKSCQGLSTQKSFAERLHIDQQRLSGYENSTRIPHHVIAALVRMGANPHWLLFGEGPMRRDDNDEGDGLRATGLRVVAAAGLSVEQRRLAEFHVLPLYSDEVAAGTPREMRDTEIEGPAVIHRDWCPNPETTDYVRVHSTGDSMVPTIPPGAMVTIDRSHTDPETMVGKVVAIGLREGGVTLKRLRRDGRGGFVGVPDNGNGHAAVPLAEGDRIVGLVRTVHARLH